MAAALLNSLPDTPLGTELFDAVAKKTVSCCIELVVVSGEYPIEVLLKRRADNDTAYPGQWHCPGTFLRPGESYWSALERLAKTELLGANLVEPTLAFLQDPIVEERGSVVQVVMLSRIENVPEIGDLKWVDLDAACSGQVPGIIENHRRMILPCARVCFGSYRPS